MSDRHAPGASPAADRPAVVVRGLVKRYDDQPVLDGLDLTVMPGEVLAVTGPSGAGKSTLLHLLGAIDRPDAGTIEVDGVEIGHAGRRSMARFRRDHVGMVFQMHNLIPRLTASQNIEMAMFGTHRSRSERASRARELLEMVSLGGYADRRPPTMSGGERARVALARGMANDPAVLLADEPTGSLDDVSTRTVIDRLRHLADSQGVAVVVVSHDARLNRVATRTVRLADGRIVEPVS